MNEQNKNNKRGIFYGVIGVATLVVAIIGATFAYFTAQQTVNNAITGNMATISFGLSVSREETYDQSNGGLIPMSNTMVEAALTQNDTPCVDDNGNSVCQIYKIELTNTSSASMFLDGYVTLTGGSGASTDLTSAPTTMRWAQVFKNGSAYSTAGTTTLHADDEISITSIDAKTETDSTGYNKSNIYSTESGYLTAVTGSTNFSGNSNTVINKNYIRTSAHTGDTKYTRTADLADALVFNQYLTATSTDNATNTLYIVVWLTETGTNQTAGAEGTSVATTASDFFSGVVTFNSAQGGEVSATFSGYTNVPSDQLTT